LERIDSKYLNMRTRGRIPGHNPDKNRKDFPPCYSQSPLQLCLRFIFFKLTQPLTVSSIIIYTVNEKGENPDIKPYPLLFGLRNPYRNLSSENSQDYAQKPQRKCMFMNSTADLSLVLLRNREGGGLVCTVHCYLSKLGRKYHHH